MSYKNKILKSKDEPKRYFDNTPYENTDSPSPAVNLKGKTITCPNPHCGSHSDCAAFSSDNGKSFAYCLFCGSEFSRGKLEVEWTVLK